jgi:alpha-amylase/alpha-mannosidase (GH57 family)
MHQPYYVDPVRQTALLPWVRLHACKGYWDMIWLVEQFPEFQCTFNLTPVLLEQIEQLAQGAVRDQWLEMARTPAESLTGDQRRWLLEHHFRAHWANMVRPFPRYWSLLHKRGQKPDAARIQQVTLDFSTQDFRDLQVWFNLAWFGFAALREYPELAELREKGRDYTESDKQTVLDCQQRILQTVIARYRDAQERGQIEISTTPFYHPILPLVYDTDFGHRCLPGFIPPRRFSYPEDVRAQLELARAQYRRLFGRDPVGLWPSEGSVCPELVPILAEQGWQWLATDEEILWHSVGQQKDDGRRQLWEAYRVEHDQQEMGIVFRDRSISDFVGFSAARNTPAAAAEHVLGQLNDIAAATSSVSARSLCTVVLDGENAWEHFADGGEGFLRGLYGGLLKTGQRIRSTTVARHFAAFPPQKSIRQLHTGSWINANFQIWIGQLEDRRAWDALGYVRNAVAEKVRQKALTEDQQRQAMQELYAAEGSDWFWWYGDDFVTDDDLVFDELFRTHLRNACLQAGLPPPPVLQVPICRSETVGKAKPPTGLLAPTIDGRITSYYEWVGAGHYQAHQAGSTMFRGDQIVDGIWFGFGAEQFYLRIDFAKQQSWTEGLRMVCRWEKPHPLTIVFQRSRQEIEITVEQGSEAHVAGIVAVYEQVLEVAIPTAVLGWTRGEQVLFRLSLEEGQVQREEHPPEGFIETFVPEDESALGNWSV